MGRESIRLQQVEKFEFREVNEHAELELPEGVKIPKDMKKHQVIVHYKSDATGGDEELFIDVSPELFFRHQRLEAAWAFR